MFSIPRAYSKGPLLISNHWAINSPNTHSILKNQFFLAYYVSFLEPYRLIFQWLYFVFILEPNSYDKNRCK